MKIIYSLIFLILSTQSFAINYFSQTTSGGVSLGAYQAGYLYYLSTQLKKEKSVAFESDVFTGASAGGINSLISIMESCSDEVSAPMESTHWQFWEGIGLNSIYKKDEVKAYSIFNRPNTLQALKALREKWFAGMRKGCTTYLGLSITRLREELIHLNDNLTLGKLKENIAFKIVGMGHGIAPKIENFPIRKNGNIGLPFSKIDSEKNYNLLESALYASSAFPLAFRPVEVEYCLLKNHQKWCDAGNTQKKLFVDGGIFDNTPLNFANKILQKLGRDKEYGHVVMDSGSHIFTFEQKNNHESLKDVDMTELTYSLFSRFINASQNYELIEFVNNNPEKLKKVFATRNEFSLISTPLFHFFGFFETAFRKFDFYLGMNDARILIEKTMGRKDFVFATLPSEDKRKMLCLKDRNYCGDVNDKNFLKLFQVSLYKLYSFCDPLIKKENNVKVFSSECELALNGKDVPIVYGEKLENWRIGHNEPGLNYSIRLLTGVKFHFKEIANDTDARVVLKDIKTKIHEMLQNIIGKQKDDFVFKNDSFGKNVVDLIDYTAKKNYFFINFGKSLEVGYKMNPFDYIFLENFNLSTSLMYQSTFPSLTSDKVDQSLIPMIGLAYQIPYISSISSQFSLGMKYGYQYSTGDDAGKEPCKSEAQSVTSCSTGVKQFFASMMFFDRLGITYAYQFYKNPILGSHIQDKYLFLTLYLGI